MNSTAKQLDEAISFINHARDELKQGNIVDLKDFQTDLTKICADIAEMSETAKLQFPDKLETLTELLQLYKSEMDAQQALIQKEILTLNQRQKALKTYVEVNHTGIKEDGSE